MNVLIFTESAYVRKNFVSSLIPNGLSAFQVEKSEDILIRMEEKNADIIIYDVIQENYDEVFEVMDKVKSEEQKGGKHIGQILLISSVDKNSIVQALKHGASGFIKSNATGDVLAKYIIEIYQKIKGVSPERKFARVSLDTTSQAERIGVKFRSPVNLQLIMGVIKDISAGGIAIELVGTFDESAIKVSQEIRNIQFILDRKDVQVDAVVVAYQKNFCALRFVNLSASDQNTISDFIFEKISV